MKKLPVHFYNRPDVLLIARELIGKIIVTSWNGVVTSGRIVESEAYDGVTDRASHAFGGRRTNRNETMYAAPGTAYVYICYGIHHLFNVITNKKEIPHAVLIRSLEPLSGIDVMSERRRKKPDFSITKGPGSLSVALGISKKHDGYSLNSHELYIADDGFRYSENQIACSPRIGVESAREAAKFPYRFYVKGNPFVSGSPK